MDNRVNPTPAEPTVAQAIREVADEIKQSLHTRFEMLRRELRENLDAWKVALPVAAVAAVLLGTAYILFVSAVAALIALGFAPSPFRWVIAFAIVGAIWSVPGAIMAYFALNKLRKPPVVPQKTLEVLKADKEWLESEIKAA